MSKRIFTATPKNYGGAYDVDPEMFFTREDLNELGDAVIEKIPSTFGENFKLEEAYIGGTDNQEVTVRVEDLDSLVSFEGTAHIDMRKIKRPSDLVAKYVDDIVSQIMSGIMEYDNQVEYNGEDIESSTQVVEAGLFGNRKKNKQSDAKSRMDEYLNRVNQVGGQLDDLQKDALAKYGNKSVNSANDMLPGPGDYDPPEDEFEYDDVEEVCELDMDNVVIIISDDGNSWDYEDKSYEWAKASEDSEDLYSDEYPNVLLSDHTGTVENVDSLLESLLPAEPGKYSISGHVKLVYDIEGIAYKTVPDYEGGSATEEYSDDAQASFNFRKSSITDFKYKKAR